MTPQTIIIDSEQKRDRAIAVLSKLPIDKPLDVTIQPHVEHRSLTQNARLWALHTLAAEVVGCSPADMHEEMLCQHYGYTEVKMPGSYVRRIPLERSSTKNKAPFARFMEFVETFYITNLGVWLE